MGLLSRIETPGKRRDILRLLLRKLGESENYRTLLDEALAEAKFELADSVVQQLRDDPATYLLDLQGPLSSPAEAAKKMASSRTFDRNIDFDDPEQVFSAVFSRILWEIDPALPTDNKDAIRRHVEDLFNAILADQQLHMAVQDRRRLFERIMSELVGFGPIEPLIADKTVTEILVLGPERVFVRRGEGKREKTDITFKNDGHMLRILDRMCAPTGTRIDASSPTGQVQLTEARATVIIQPPALSGPTLTIHKPAFERFHAQDLVTRNSLSPDVWAFLQACVLAGLNVLISGNAGSGKTTLLNVLANSLPEHAFIITVEEFLELNLKRPMVATLVKWALPLAKLVDHAVLMRYDHLIVGEIVGDEIVSLLPAQSWMATIYGLTPDHALQRLEMMCAGGSDQHHPAHRVRAQIANGIDLIVHMEQLIDGSRKITGVYEVVSMGDGSIAPSQIIAFRQTGGEEGRILGQFEPTDTPPTDSLLKRVTSWPVPDNLQQPIKTFFDIED